MKKLTSELDDATEVKARSKLDMTLEKVSDPIPQNDRLHIIFRRNSENASRKKIDDLADARWLRDQLRDWDG